MQSNNNLVLMILIFAGIVGGYLYHTNISSELFINPPLNGKTGDLDDFKDISLTLSDKEITRIDSLRVFGESPVNPGLTGKRNIFAPF